ncbi:MAG: C25 family cysteine peptidase [Candidatus Thorarchaeota archaeon]
MKKEYLNRRETYQKFTAVFVITMIIISSASMIQVMIETGQDNEVERSIDSKLARSVTNKQTSVLAQEGSWVSFDMSANGTPAEAHITGSDMSGITIVANFHGFWRSNTNINGTQFDDLKMPGAGSLQNPGAPVLPCLFEYIEIPHDINVSVDILTSSTNTSTGYNIGPAVYEDIPYPIATGHNDTVQTTPLPINYGPEYSNDSFFPGIITSTEGAAENESMIMRGHRLLGLSFYPVQYNPTNTTLLFYSQIVAKINYSIPKLIQPVENRLRSDVFDRILGNMVLNYASIYPTVAHLAYSPTSMALAQEYEGDAEYLIITTQNFKFQADRLAEWKERKGVPSEVITVTAGDGDEVAQEIHDAYTNGNPPPSYVLLLGDVNDIPTRYDTAMTSSLFMYFSGDIASDLSYFNIDGAGYLPEMVYSRISVDTQEQAQTIVDKILQYEQSPPFDSSFYKDVFFAGEFSDLNPLDGKEDSEFKFLSILERIRHFLKDEYTPHINYSSMYMNFDYPGHVSGSNIDLADLELYYSTLSTSNLVIDSISTTDYPNFAWLGRYDWYWDLIGADNPFYADARDNVTRSFNEGKFLVLYFGHGGSKNMVTTAQRDFVEGWQHPFFNTSYFSDLTNGVETPLIISMACSTGWFDGETDEAEMYVGDLGGFLGHNLFEDYENECFAENITRLEGGGAVAAISSSRPGHAGVSAYLMDGIIAAFWPEFTEASGEPIHENGGEPIYEMGGALLAGKLYAKEKWRELYDASLIGFREAWYPQHKADTTFHEYHLFGDPETELWTDVPSPLEVTYPESIGLSPSQRLLITVRNQTSGLPVDHARVCIQQEIEQEDGIYQIGYTDANGEISFYIATHASSPNINVTVTKHNYRPHIGEIVVLDMIGPVILLVGGLIVLVIILIIRRQKNR